MPAETPLILIVDDEKTTSQMMSMALKAVGYRVIEADSGNGGLELAKTEHPQLIILDYHMQDKDGVTVLRELRQDTWGKSVPVILASNIYDVDIVNDILGLGVQDYVLKSDVNLSEIVQLVGQYIPLPGRE